MKRFIATIAVAVLALAGTSAFAQIGNVNGQWSAGGGYIAFNLAGSGSDLVEKEGFLSSIPGFYFGASLDYAFSTIDGLTVEPGAYIMHFGKAFKFGRGDTGEKSYHANYLSVPINLKYAIPTGSDFGLAVFTGPRFNLGIGGNMFSTGKTYPGLRPIEAQWGVGLAATIQDAVIVRVGYDTGLTKCIRDNSELGFNDNKAHRDAFYVGVGFAF